MCSIFYCFIVVNFFFFCFRGPIGILCPFFHQRIHQARSLPVVKDYYKIGSQNSQTDISCIFFDLHKKFQQSHPPKPIIGTYIIYIISDYKYYALFILYISIFVFYVMSSFELRPCIQYIQKNYLSVER